MLLIALLLLSLATTPQLHAQSSSNGNTTGATEQFQLKEGQSVYVVGLNADSRDLGKTSANLEIERKAIEQFRKEKRFRPAKTLRDADFVFLVVLDSDSADFDEIALVVSSADFRRTGRDLDKLRDLALWQDSSRINRGREAALAGATLGMSSIFRRKSVAQDLVRKFHSETATDPAP